MMSMHHISRTSSLRHSLYYYSYLFRLLEFKVKEVYTAYGINIF